CRLINALGETVLLGIRTNKSFLVDILSHPAFIAGSVTTGFLQDHLPGPVPASAGDLERARALAAALRVDIAGPTGELKSWWSTGPAIWLLTVEADGEAHRLAVEASEHRYSISHDEHTTAVEIVSRDDHRVRYRIDGLDGWASYAISGTLLHLD